MGKKVGIMGIMVGIMGKYEFYELKRIARRAIYQTVNG